MKATTIAAIYTFAAHYHSGQWSRGYALLCAADRAWRRHAGIGPRLDYWESQLDENPKGDIARLYNHFGETYGEVV